MTIERIAAPTAPSPAGHYVAATRAGGLVFVSGQLPRDPGGALAPTAPFADQARQAIANLIAVLTAAGCTPDDVVKLNAYIVGVEHWPAFNSVMAAIFGDARPARAVISVPELHDGWLVEVDCIAAG